VRLCSQDLADLILDTNVFVCFVGRGLSRFSVKVLLLLPGTTGTQYKVLGEVYTVLLVEHANAAGAL
jgi:hypothetical protein